MTVPSRNSFTPTKTDNAPPQPETKGLSLEQVDKMMEETNPRHSAKWVPHSTFAGEMGIANRGLSISAPGEKGIHATHAQEV